MGAITLELADQAATERLGARLAPLLGPGDLLTLTGDLGAGKTCLARALIRALTGPDQEVPSPTFTLVQTYDSPAATLWHFDLYRLGGPDEVIELGWEEALGEGISLVEWPERLGTLLPADHLALTLSHGARDGARVARLEGHGRLAARLAAWATPPDDGAWLAPLGWGEAAASPLAGDASARRYTRLAAPGGRRALLAHAPDAAADLAPFVTIGRLLARLGLSVPTVLAAELARLDGQGRLLLEDFGDDTFTRLLDQGQPAQALYALATDVLVTLQQRFSLDQALGLSLPRFDGAAFLEQVQLFPEQWLPQAGPTAQDEFTAAWTAVLPLVAAGPETLVLRDYHVGNLMRLPGRAGVAGCGVLDFQNAGLGPPGYDLISLIEDARREVPPALGAVMIERYLTAMGERVEPAAFRRALPVLAAVRHTRILAVFVRLARRDRKPGYLVHLPRIWRQLEGRLSAPELAPVAAWFAHHLPPGPGRTAAGLGLEGV